MTKRDSDINNTINIIYDINLHFVKQPLIWIFNYGDLKTSEIFCRFCEEFAMIHTLFMSYL